MFHWGENNSWREEKELHQTTAGLQVAEPGAPGDCWGQAASVNAATSGRSQRGVTTFD